MAVEAKHTDKSKKLVHLGKIATKEGYYRVVMYNTSSQFSGWHPEEEMWLDKKI